MRGKGGVWAPTAGLRRPVPGLGVLTSVQAGKAASWNDPEGFRATREGQKGHQLEGNWAALNDGVGGEAGAGGFQHRGGGGGVGGGIQLVTPSPVCSQGRHTGTCPHTLGVSLEFSINSSLDLGLVRESERTTAPVGVSGGHRSPSLLPASQPPAPCPGVRGLSGSSPVPTPGSQSCRG